MLAIEQKREIKRIAQDDFPCQQFTDFLRPFIKNGDFEYVHESFSMFLKLVSEPKLARSYMSARLPGLVLLEFFNSEKAIKYSVHNDDWSEEIQESMLCGTLRKAVQNLQSKISIS